VYTDEQQQIIDACVNPDNHLIKVSSVAGSGKTHTLKGIAKALKANIAIYTAFNASVIADAKLTFPGTTVCKTLHALAYHYVIKLEPDPKKKFQIEEISIDTMKIKETPENKRKIISAMNQFFNSSSLSLSFIDEIAEEPKIAKEAKNYIEKMLDNKIPVTFGFLLKYFYLQLAEGNIQVECDLLMLDEAGDLSEVTIEVFKLINAPKKVMVGDPHQNIYGFMNTVNGFEILKDEGVQLTLSQSFRVSTEIAKNLEVFCQGYLDPNMQFKGVDIPNKTIHSRAFIARTNSGLISRMMDLHKTNTHYTLVRTAADIFALPLALISVVSKKEIFKKEYKFLEKDYSHYLKTPELQLDFKSFHGYIKEIHADDVNLITAVRLLEKHSYGEIFDCFKQAKEQPTKRQSIILTTAHVSKGQTYDAVYIEDDLNKAVKKVKESGVNTAEDLAELNLYYVACSRTRLELINATELTTKKLKDTK